MSQCALIIQNTFNQHFHLTTGFLGTKQACRDHAGIIKYQQIIGGQHVYKLDKLVICYFPRLFVQNQQATIRTLIGRVLGDQFIGKVKIEVLALHGVDINKYGDILLSVRPQIFYTSRPVCPYLPKCRGGGTGRRAGFKIRFLHGSAGSIPALGTIF